MPTDAQGRTYYDIPGGGKSYVSPVAFGGTKPADTTGPWRERPQWDHKTGTWKTPLDMGNILSAAVGGVMAAPLVAGALPAGAAASAATAGATATGTGAMTVAAPGMAGTLLKYGLQYGLPIAGNLLGTKMQTNAQGESDRATQDYYNRALDAEKEERDYRRTFDEGERDYVRAFGEDGRRYGRYSDTYGREGAEESLQYGRAGDTYGRESDEERLAYDRSQAIRDRNYGYQQYGNFVETLEPFRAGGSAAASRMSGLMGGPTPQDTGSYLNLARTARDSVQDVPDVPNRPTWAYSGTRPMWNYEGGATTEAAQPNAGGPPVSLSPPTSTTQPVGGRPALVLVEGPDGSRRELPEDQAAAAVSRGARRIS